MDYQERNAHDNEIEAERIAGKKTETSDAKPFEVGLKRVAKNFPPIPKCEEIME